jgi:hypothetical protein
MIPIFKIVTLLMRVGAKPFLGYAKKIYLNSENQT